MVTPLYDTDAHVWLSFTHFDIARRTSGPDSASVQRARRSRSRCRVRHALETFITNYGTTLRRVDTRTGPGSKPDQNLTYPAECVTSDPTPRCAAERTCMRGAAALISRLFSMSTRTSHLSGDAVWRGNAALKRRSAAGCIPCAWWVETVAMACARGSPRRWTAPRAQLGRLRS